MDLITLLGLVAGTLTTASFFPQLTRILRNRSAHDLSWGMLTMFGSGVVLWLIYGLAHSDVAIIASNIVTIGLITAIGVLKFHYGRLAQHRVAAARSIDDPRL